MAVIRRDRKSSSLELVKALRRLAPLLAGQGENDAATFMTSAATALEKQEQGSKAFAATIVGVLAAFEGEEFELMAYTLKTSDDRDWSQADELSVASNRVLALARRLK